MLRKVVRQPRSSLESRKDWVRVLFVFDGSSLSITGGTHLVSLYSTALVGDLDSRSWRPYWKRSRHSFNCMVLASPMVLSLIGSCFVRTLRTRMVALKGVRWDDLGAFLSATADIL